jgi:hypothetical protein
MRWVMVLCLVVGCAENAGMRPRGLRNSVRIESLERRIAKTEDKLGIKPERPPPQPRTDLERSGVDKQIDAVADRLTTIDKRIDALADRLLVIDERIATLLAAQSVIQRELATIRVAAPPTPTPASTRP